MVGERKAPQLSKGDQATQVPLSQGNLDSPQRLALPPPTQGGAEARPEEPVALVWGVTTAPSTPSTLRAVSFSLPF